MKFRRCVKILMIGCGLGIIGFTVGCWQAVSFQSVTPGVSLSYSDHELNINQVYQTNEVLATSKIMPPATPETNNLEINTNNILAERLNSNAKVKNRGTLRISNRTSQPVRLALLARGSSVKESRNQKLRENIPAHWDFDPEEGIEKGLILSLPGGKLQLDQGDVMVAFAQDVSRRNWGPYVAGETVWPEWKTEKGEWFLVFSP